MPAPYAGHDVGRPAHYAQAYDIMMPNMLIPKGIPENVGLSTLLKQMGIGKVF
jgi:hypothetical protein